MCGRIHIYDDMHAIVINKTAVTSFFFFLCDQNILDFSPIYSYPRFDNTCNGSTNVIYLTTDSNSIW